jgi:glycosyltransferase involved in cell wall biosynthesis
MKILIITTNGITAPFQSWPERLQARGLARRGHQVRAITYRGKQDFNRLEHEVIDEVAVHRVKRRGWLSLQLARDLLTGPKPEVVHFHHLSNQLAYEAALICKLRRIPLVMTPHGLFHDPYLVADRDRPFNSPARYSEMILSAGQFIRALRKQFKPKRHLKNYLNHRPLLMMDRVIVLSQHGKEVALKLGVPEKRLAIVPNAIDRDWADEPGELPAEVKGIDGPLVLYLGQFKYRKGFDLLAKAIPAILAGCPGARFVFAGHSPIHEAELIRLAEAAKARDKLVLLHSVSEGEKAALFRRAAQNGVYVLPTRYEGFGIPLIEAMSLGCPVISTEIPVIDELIKAGENGLLFPLEDVDGLAAAVVRVLGDPQLRQQLAQGGLETVQRYFTPVILDRLEALYREVSRR